MNQNDLEYIVNLVTQQVLSAVGGKTDSCAEQNTDGYAKMLVLGNPNAAIPEELCANAVAYGLEDYQANRNILRYDRVVITCLNNVQLADIALARPTDDFSDAVITALLSGIDTYMLEDACSFRQYAGKGSIALYRTLENYARTLQVYGVKATGQRPKQVLTEAKPPKFKAPAIVVPKGHGQPNPGRLITEGQARELLKGGSPVHLPADAIVTPLARDLFSHAGAEILKDL